MRKHFLILMLLTLLPFTAFGALVKVTPYNISKYYGQDDAGITLIFEESAGLTSDNANVLRAGLYISRNGVNAGEAVGDYTYTLGFDPDNISAEKKTQYNIDDDKIAAFTAANTVAIQGSATLSIRKMPLSNAAITVAGIPDQEKTGSAITPSLTVTNTANGEALVEGSDYTVTWTGNTDGPQATGTLTAIGSNYSGSKAGLTFNIKQSIADAVIVLTGASGFTYDATAHVPTSMTVTVGGVLLTENTDYTVAYTNSNTGETNPTVNAGTVTITVTGKAGSNYSGSATTTYQIAARTVENISITNEETVDFTGSPVYAAVTAVTADTLPVTTDDYDVSTESVNRGAGVATLTLKRNFIGSKTFEYTITPKAITAPTITLEQEEGRALNHYLYAKADIQPTATVLSGAATLAETDYQIFYDNDNDLTNEADLKSAGVKKVIVKQTATGNYTFADAELAYTVDQRPLTISAGDLTVGVGSNYYPVATISNLAGTPSSIQLKAADGLNEELNGTISFTYAQNATNVANPADAGNYTITPVLTAGTGGLNANYTYTNVETGTLSITQSQIIVKVVDQPNVIYGAAPAAFTLEHVSGLAANQVATFMANLNTTVAAAVTANSAAWTYDADEMKNVGEYSINYQEEGQAVGFITDNNYVITVQPGTLTINAKEITDAMIQNIAAVDYTGVAQDLAVVIMDGTNVVPATEYTVTWADLVNAGTRQATITDVDGGNYYIRRNAGTNANPNWVNTRLKNYTINKINLDITAEDGTWTYGSTEQNFNYTIDTEDLVDADKQKTEAQLGISGVKVKIVSALTVGVHEDGLEPYGATATNYTINYVKGDLTIEKGTIIAKVQDKTVEYGDVLADGAFKLEAVSGMLESEAANFDAIVNYSTDLADYDYDAAEMSDVNTDGYTISFTGDAPTATNYTVKVLGTGLLKVTPKNITVKSLNQTAPVNDPDAFDEVPSLASATVANPTVAIVAGNLVGEDGIDAIIEKLTAETSLTATNYIQIVLKENPLYIVTIDTENAGVLTITGGQSITLGNDEEDDLAEIAEWAASPYQVNVKMNFANRKGRTFGTSGLGVNWIAENWATMVLPFDITVADLSKKLGYAIVNVIDADAYSTDAQGNPVFKFALTMKGGNGSTEVLKANRPFVIKLADDVVTTEDIDFGSRKIVAATEEDILEAGGGFTFEGTYTKKTVTPTANNSYWFLLGDYADWAFINSTADATVWKWNIVPFEAYINTADGTPAHEATFIMEEMDGSTTEIKTVNVDNKNAIVAEGLYNLNGVKLNTVPAQKGVYIQNGKKIVVK